MSVMSSHADAGHQASGARCGEHGHRASRRRGVLVFISPRELTLDASRKGQAFAARRLVHRHHARHVPRGIIEIPRRRRQRPGRVDFEQTIHLPVGASLLGGSQCYSSIPRPTRLTGSES